MAQLLFKNTPPTTLAGPITSTATTLQVASGAGASFPSPGAGQEFTIFLTDAATRTLKEVMIVSAVTGDVFTVTRGQDGTSAQVWNAGDFVVHGPVALWFGAFQQTNSAESSGIYEGQDTSITGNAVTVPTTSPAITSPATGNIFFVTKSAQGNTGATTCAIGSGGALPVIYKDGSPLNPGDWPDGAEALLYFSGSVYQFLACQANPAVQTFYAVDSGTADAMVATPVPPVPALTTNVSLLAIKGASPNATTTPTINVSGLGPKTITRLDGSALLAGDLPASALLPLHYDGTVFRLKWPITPKQVVTKLSGNLTIYVRTDGNDSNNGLTNSAGGAFATIQGAWNAIFGLYDPAGFTITIQLGITGTYAGAAFSGYNGSVILSGISGSESSCIIDCPGSTANVISCSMQTLTIQHCVLSYTYNSTATTESTVDCSGGGEVIIGPAVTYSCANNRANLWENYASGAGSTITFANGSTTTVEGAGSRNNFAATLAGGLIQAGNAPVTTYFVSSGTIVYTQFANADLLSSQDWAEANFASFTATGSRYAANRNSVIGLSGVTLPGSTAGTTANGGIAI
jgi:hypothetical protein